MSETEPKPPPEPPPPKPEEPQPPAPPEALVGGTIVEHDWKPKISEGMPPPLTNPNTTGVKRREAE